MDSRRQLKIASLIQEAFTEILKKEGKGVYGRAFVTVTNVKVTSDLTLARFYLSIYNAEDPDAVIEQFNHHMFELKRHLAEKLRFQLRRIPEIEFFRDDTLEQAYHIEEVFKKIKAEDESLKQQAAPGTTGRKKAATGSKPAAKKTVRKKKAE